MGAGHSHGSHRRTAPAPVGHRPRRVLLGLLALVALLTVGGLLALWPDSAALDEVGSRADFAGPGVTFPRAEVEQLDGRALEARVLEGDDEGDVVPLELPPQVAQSGLQAGDTVLLRRGLPNLLTGGPALLLGLRLYELPLLELLSTEEITGEVVRTLVTSIGLVLAVPVTLTAPAEPSQA